MTTPTDYRALCGELVSNLSELHAIVKGECPSLLDEDSGGSSWLDYAIDSLLDRARSFLAAPEAVDSICTGCGTPRHKAIAAVPDYRALIAELLNGLVEQQNPKHPWPGYTQSAMERARALLAAPEAVGVADEELGAFLLEMGLLYETQSSNPLTSVTRRRISGRQLAEVIREAITRYGTAHPAPVPVSERLPELRGMFERILSKARCMETRTVGNIELADRLLDAVVDWSLPLPGAQP